MKNALLPNGNIVNAKEYDPLIHGKKLYCCSCKKPVHYCGQGNSNREAFFKTNGRGNSKHKPDCIEIRELKQVKTLRKLNEYTTTIKSVPLESLQVIKIDFDNAAFSHVPSGEVDEIGRNSPKKRFNYVLKYSGRKKSLVKKISSLATIARLLENNSPEDFKRIAFEINGKILFIHELVIDQNTAHKIVSLGNFHLLECIVYGKVRSVVRLEKVMYINLDEQDEMKPFSAFVFSSHYKYFTYTKEQLEGNYILIQGQLSLNKQKNKPQIHIKWNKQVHILK